MAEGSVKTQGTELYFVDPGDDPTPAPLLAKMNCPTGITGLGGARDQIDDTCLDANDRTYESGLGNPGQISVPYVLKPGMASHQRIFALKESGHTLKWIICLSDNTTQPTLGADGEIVPPTDRTSFMFDGNIADNNIDIATNEVVRGTLTIQRSGPVTATWKP